MNDRDLMERTFTSLGAIQDYMHSIQTVVGRMDERLKGIEADNKRHSGRFERIDSSIEDVEKTADTRVKEVWEALDDRLRDLREDQKDFFKGIALNDAEIKKDLASLKQWRTEQTVDRRWTVAIASGVSAVVSGLFVAVASALILH